MHIESDQAVERSLSSVQIFEYQIQKCFLPQFCCQILIISPLVCNLGGIINNKKLEKIQERSLRILFNDYKSDVHELLDSMEVRHLPYGD